MFSIIALSTFVVGDESPEFLDDLFDFAAEEMDADEEALIAPLPDRRRAGSGCTGIDATPQARYCTRGPSVSYHYLGNWSSGPTCQEKCTTYLAGAEGCCFQKYNKAHCYVVKGGAADNVKVAPHSFWGLKAVMCNVPNDCEGLSASPGSQFCGTGAASLGNVLQSLGNWATGPTCSEKCSAELAGEEGCCMQKNNKAHCYVVKGGAAQSVQVARHSSGSLQAIMCNAPQPIGGSCPGIMTAPEMTHCGFNSMFTLGTQGQFLDPPTTESCEVQCVRYLAGRRGCCLRSKNKTFCVVTLGDRAQGVFVRSLNRPKLHNTQVQAAMCN